MKMSENNTQLKLINNQTFEGERPLFKSSFIELQNCEFSVGESAIKESHNIKASECTFSSKYLFWHDNNLAIDKSYFSEGGRASIWYSQGITLTDSKVDAPKIFRDAQNISIQNCELNTDETLWDCVNIDIKHSKFTGDYLLLHSSNITLENFTLDGNYSFQHTKNMTIKNAKIKSKDAFWNSENVTVYDSVIEGEYLGWYAKNLKLVNCTIKGTQALCYMDNLVMENCEMIDTDLVFEYSSLHVDIKNSIDSVKNPLRGSIKAKEIKELILDDERVEHENLNIEVAK
jgi:hypothetical protein